MNISDEPMTRLTELSPSAKFVYAVLQSHGTLDQDGIANRTLLPIRTVRYALDKLERADLIEEDHGVRDARRRRYRTKSPRQDE